MILSMQGTEGEAFMSLHLLLLRGGGKERRGKKTVQIASTLSWGGEEVGLPADLLGMRQLSLA